MTFAQLDQPSKNLITALETKADALFAAMEQNPPTPAFSPAVTQAKNLLDQAIDALVVAIGA